MLHSRLPKFILDNYECQEWKHASAILSQDFRPSGTTCWRC